MGVRRYKIRLWRNFGSVYKWSEYLADQITDRLDIRPQLLLNWPVFNCDYPSAHPKR
ncbi:hypothetical protein RSal33209_3107 [Renibacterium salmoninarum ATCC 33209]|uniref:Uncharacterized protein n=1 Tax=Renibacterium salmoninarum (strain ATCC 33209 / DSM 20767 / JCM 11484 / NBRC 15589 / NCIMB 2235) TaxID=288705 RepID=A9WUF4_RENSM|nr:hypothetical protein RSal33209_3107 [Renibacterium salmoninarum ATCC 33209]